MDIFNNYIYSIWNFNHYIWYLLFQKWKRIFMIVNMAVFLIKMENVMIENTNEDDVVIIAVIVIDVNI